MKIFFIILTVLAILLTASLYAYQILSEALPSTFGQCDPRFLARQMIPFMAMRVDTDEKLILQEYYFIDSNCDGLFDPTKERVEMRIDGVFQYMDEW